LSSSKRRRGSGILGGWLAQLVFNLLNPNRRGQAVDLAMGRFQGGAKPLGKGVVNHPEFLTKREMRAKE
jgi:hypothetical protein